MLASLRGLRKSPALSLTVIAVLALGIGATPMNVVQFVIGIGMRPVIVGAYVGTAAALALARLIEANLFETPPTDPTVFAVVIVILLFTAGLATSLPAWRATQNRSGDDTTHRVMPVV